MTGFPISEIRESFPSLESTDEGRRRIYFDNPAGTQVPRQVIDAVTDTYLHHNGNGGVFNSTSIAADATATRAHEAMAVFVGCDDPGEINIGPSMTSLTFRLAQGLAREFEPGDEIIVTRMDHEGNVSPWLMAAEERKLTIRWLPFNRDSWRIEVEDLEPLLNERTKLLALNYASNLTWAVNDIDNLIRTAKSAGALVYVDGVQYAPHHMIDVERLGCDFLAISPYKFYGPHLGVVWGRRELLEPMQTYKVRCESDDLPDRFMQGTLQFELMAGLSGTIEYIEDLGRKVNGDGDQRNLIRAAFQAMEAHENGLTQLLLEELTSIPDITLHGPANSNSPGNRVPTFSFTHKTQKPSAIAEALSREGIFCHWGHNYAFELAKVLGLDLTEGVVRVGLAHYNTESEVQHMLAFLRRVLA